MISARARAHFTLAAFAAVGAIGLGLVLAAGCGPAQPKRFPVPSNPIGALLVKHRAMQEDLVKQQGRFMQNLEAYERKKQEYQLAVAREMTTSKADKRSITQIQEMSRDAERIGKELIQGVQKLHEALLSRAEAARRVWEVEAKLTDAEIAVYGSKELAAGRGIVEARYLHEVESDLRAAQKEQQQSLVNLRDKELEAWTSIGASTERRDVADQQLADLRTQVEAAFQKLLDQGERYDDAADRMHRKIQSVMVTRDAEMGTLVQQLIDRRAQAVKELASARQSLKDATIFRAEKRAQEVGYDGEFDVVIARAFKTQQLIDAFYGRVQVERDGMIDTRGKMLNEEKAVNEVRRRILALEADIAAQGF